MIVLRYTLFITLFLILPHTLVAGGTRIWEMAGFEELEKGVLEGTALSSRGELSLGLDKAKLDMPGEVAVIWCAVKNKNGDIYFGTGYDGKIFRKRKNKIEQIADTGQLVITAMAFDAKGHLYIAALPDASIWRIQNPGRIHKSKAPEKWATLPEETEHIFSLAFDKAGRTLYIGTGPEGDIFAIGKDKKPQKYLETEEEHILSLAVDKKGNLLAGTSPSGRLLSVSGPGRAKALADFDATEVKAIAIGDEALFVAVNEFKSPPKVPTKKSSVTTNKSSASVLGDGYLYSVDNVGRQRLLWKEKKSHVVSLALAADGTLFAGLGNEGKVISIDPERLIRTEIDLEERQVMALLADKTLLFAGTGDAGAVYDVFRARHKEALYLSPILDTETVSNWGRMEWLAEGRLKVQVRTGNTMAPDKSWSDWSAPVKMGVEISSPPARYLQLRFGFEDDAEAVLISAQLAYKPQNLKATITEFNPDTPFPKPSSSDDNISDRTIAARPDMDSDPELNLRWKVDNPDGDELRYRLWYRAVGEKLWRPMLKPDEVLGVTRYTWDTTSIPEGNYQIKLIADDSISNDPRAVTEDTYVSVPVLIDNHQPKLRNLTVKKGRIHGVAEDGFSKIGAVELSVDNGPWIPLAPKDGLYDEKAETFDAPLPEDIDAGPHAAAVRTYDRRGNMGVGEVLFIEKK
jgi:hypothetical protein